MSEQRFDVAQPICDACHRARFGMDAPERIVLRERVRETCCDCGMATVSGAYAKVDPSTVAFPTALAD